MNSNLFEAIVKLEQAIHFTKKELQLQRNKGQVDSNAMFIAGQLSAFNIALTIVKHMKEE